MHEDQRRQAIELACRYIVAQQRPADGGFGENKAVVAFTSLSILALMAHGSNDQRGPYGMEIHRGINFLLDLIENPQDPHKPEGYFHHSQDPNSRMHGQGYATLALATALGTATEARHRRLLSAVRKAVTCIEQSQHSTGGFGYEPVRNTGEHEGSVTVTVAQGLRAASEAGVLVDRNVVRKGLAYLKKSQNDDGSFRYSLYVRRSSYALTAAALSSFFLYGEYADDADRTLERGLTFMMDGPPSSRGVARPNAGLDEVKRNPLWYFYGNFYAAWTCWQIDGSSLPERGSYWDRWTGAMYGDILSKQINDGSFPDEQDRFEFGPLLPTTFAVLTLAIPDETIPIFHR